MTSVWHIADRDELHRSAHRLHDVEAGGCCHRLVSIRSGVWVISQWASGARAAFRVAFAPGALSIDGLTVDSDGLTVGISMSSSIGTHEATVKVDANDGILSATTSLRPHTDLAFTGWPRDVIADLDANDGTVHTSQRGLRTGLVHASLTGTASGSFMYVQDLTVLGDYFQATQSSGCDTVSGDWPDLGFALPAGSNHLPALAATRIAAWHVAFAEHVPTEPVAVADQYLDLLSRLYFHIDRPEPDYVDWRQRAEACRTDIEHPDCWSVIGDKRYLRAYIGDDNHPPESMVQLAVLIPLIERGEWCQYRDPLADAVGALLPRFHDERTGSMARWLPEAEHLLEGNEPHEHPRLMDSWYVFHPLLNLARLAEHGDDAAGKQLISCLDPVIEVAHHFDYEWPVFYDVDTLEVIQAESAPGKGGELDVPGLYAHVMLQAFQLTEDRRFLDEAIAAARSLRGKGFELTYQTNNVAFGMVALLKLGQLTGDDELLDISRVLCACLLDNAGLWSMRYGHARDWASFFGVFPMPTTPYTAAYEQAEVSSACLDYIVHADELPASMSVLLPELIRHVTSRLDTYFPTNIPRSELAEQPKTGHLLPDLWIPVEDLGDAWAEAGAVGQEVYGAGIAFSTLARSYVHLPGRSTQVYCEYPYAVTSLGADDVTLHVYGDNRLRCRLRVLDDDGLPASVQVVGSESGTMEPSELDPAWCDYLVPAGQDVMVILGP